MQQFAEEMVSLVAEDSESVIAFLGGCKKQLTDLETEEVIQRSQSRRQSQEKIKAFNSQQKVGETLEALEQVASRLEEPRREKAETASPTAPMRSVVKPPPPKPAPRAKDVGKVSNLPASPSADARASKQTDSPPVKPRRRATQSSEPEVAGKDVPDPGVPTEKFPLPADPVVGVAPAQSLQEQQHAAPPKDKPPPVPPHRPTATAVAPPKEKSPPVPHHRASAAAVAPPEKKPPPVPQHRSASTPVAPYEDNPPPVPPHRSAATAVAPPEDEQPPVPPHQTTQVRQPPPKPPRGNFTSRQIPPVPPLQEVEESLSPSSNTPPQEHSPNGAVIQVDSCLDMVTEEDETTKYSHPGSPASFSSQDSSRSEEEKRAENEKKFDTLSMQEAKVLQGRKERLKALKKKKEKGDMRLSCEDISGMQVGEWW